MYNGSISSATLPSEEGLFEEDYNEDRHGDPDNDNDAHEGSLYVVMGSEELQDSLAQVGGDEDVNGSYGEEGEEYELENELYEDDDGVDDDGDEIYEEEADEIYHEEEEEDDDEEEEEAEEEVDEIFGDADGFPSTMMLLDELVRGGSASRDAVHNLLAGERHPASGLGGVDGTLLSLDPFMFPLPRAPQIQTDMDRGRDPLLSMMQQLQLHDEEDTFGSNNVNVLSENSFFNMALLSGRRAVTAGGTTATDSTWDGGRATNMNGFGSRSLLEGADVSSIVYVL